MQYTLASSLLLLTGTTLAAPVVEQRAACADVHIFGARETTVSSGFGSAGTVVNLIKNAHPGATTEVIDYPAAGGNSYGSSVQTGTKAVASQVAAYVKACPNAKIVMVGYSQGSQIMTNAFCNGGDVNQGITDTTAPISSDVGSHVAAMIWMGNPRHKPGASYNVGTSTAAGFDPEAQECTAYADIIQSYCDAADPYCSNGSDASVHQGYGTEYGQAALKFVNSKLA
ncbi:putative acetyl xylan esterase protein [Lasiodiplodia theobromae]|uniref:Acetylxylan esterase n=1 Tax=Lasiodiplodia theobromae TaxID=45133 RepID=A0A5N5DBR1_9PEZI|nr:Acetyl xylan esterase [Lasiodiplodia theobromae]KAB2574622.1 Acetylxylan esterase [Lasiodiplodia theobromae]KAF4545966.1 Acetyl xylan esterase [Lasiodiplodia theobromae]KAF9635033.1 putative acetyl xylan esterase protein [Lasiodiplodia theobromae]